MKNNLKNILQRKHLVKRFNIAKPCRVVLPKPFK